MKPLSVGNIVSSGLRIYRNNFKDYFKLSLISYLWLLVPIYGWAKYAGIMGLLSRLAYKEVIGQPETIKDARRYVKPRKWDLFFAGILVFLIPMIAIFTLGIFLSILISITYTLRINFLRINFITITGIIIILGVIFLFYSISYIATKLIVFEFPLVLEAEMNPIKSIQRGWKLTTGFVFKLILVWFIAFLISLPVSIAVNIFSTIIRTTLTLMFQPIIGNTSDFLQFIVVLPVFITAIISGAFMIPFWQSIKAAIYHDLLVRKEGLDLDLKNQ